MVLCSVHAFENPSTSQSICKLPESSCTDRYDNLQPSPSQSGPVDRTDVDRAMAELIFKRNLDAVFSKRSFLTENLLTCHNNNCVLIFPYISTILSCSLGW